MNKFFKPVALIGLALTILPPILLFVGMIGLPLTKGIMLAGMIVWYLAATPWLAFQELKPSDTEVEI